MAFKSVKEYNEQRFGGLFLLRNHGDYADVVFLYRNLDDVLIADTHYIKSPDYSGYVHCCGRGCPACERGIRVQSKLFIPVYNLTANEIQFWDRSVRFENQLSADVFERCPNPSDFVFRITRNGAAGDINTTYNIQAVGKNTTSSYQEILNEFNVTMPDYYENICKDIPASQLAKMISSSSSGGSSYGDSLPSYQVTPRVPTASNVPTTQTKISDVGVPREPEAAIPSYTPVDSDMLPDVDETAPLDGDEEIDDVVF